MTTGIPFANGIWTWFNEPIAVYDSASNSSYYGIINDIGEIHVSQYKHSNQQFNSYSVQTTPIDSDDHNNPAVIVLSDGKILCCYSNHPGKSWSSISNNAGDILSGFTTTQLYDGSTYYGSYAHVCQTSDSSNTIWWFFREGQTTVGGMPITYRINQGGGAGGSWTANASTVKFIKNLDTANMRPYFRITKSGRRIDICYTSGHPDEISPCHLYHMYLMVSTDGTQFSAYKSDDTLIDTWAVTGGTGTVNSKTLPLNVTEGTRIYDGTTNGAWIWDVQWVGGTTLTALYPTFSTTSLTADTHKYRRATLSGGTWTNEDICYAGDSGTPSTVGRTPHWIYPDASSAQPRYSPGICLDPNTADVVYLGKKYGEGDVRMEKWTKSGASWSKTTDLTGATGNSRVNARPFSVVGRSPTQVLWFSASTYTTYTSYVTTTVGTLENYSLPFSTKPAVPVWSSSVAPAGTVAYYLMHEGSGTTVSDIAGVANGTITGGSLTWGTDAYGANLTGFTSSITIVADALTSSSRFDNTAGYPRWIAMLYKSTAATSGQYAGGFGNSGSNNPLFCLGVNQAADNNVFGNVRDTVPNTLNPGYTKTRDTSIHTLLFVVHSNARAVIYWDGVPGAVSTAATLGTYTFDRFAIGALRRGTTSNPFSGIISCFIVGVGSAPSPSHIHSDLINGQFLGARAAQSASSSVVPYMILSTKGV